MRRLGLDGGTSKTHIVGMVNNIHSIIGGILDSYHKIGGINHITGPKMPSRRMMVQIVEDLEAVIFPGYHEEEPARVENLKFALGEKVNRIARGLTEEIHKCLCFQHNVRDEDCPHMQEGKLASECRDEAEQIAIDLLVQVPDIRRRVRMDVEAAFNGDPAAKSHEEVILAYPGIEAMLVFRVAHFLWERGVPLLPRMMSEYVHGKTGIDIHPGATIGDYFFIDHASGVVVGETTVIGNNVKIYQGVTIGAVSVKKDEASVKRHPTIEDDVTIYSGATILGGNTVIGKGSLIGGNVFITASVPPNSRVFYKPSDFTSTEK